MLHQPPVRITKGKCNKRWKLQQRGTGVGSYAFHICGRDPEHKGDHICYVYVLGMKCLKRKINLEVIHAAKRN